MTCAEKPNRIAADRLRGFELRASSSELEAFGSKLEARSSEL